MHEPTRESRVDARPASARRRRAPTNGRASRAAAVAPAERLRGALHQRLIAFYLMPSEADHWIDIWTTTVADGDPCSVAYWDQGFRWILTAIDGHGRERVAPCSDVDPALAAVITRGFRV